MFYALGAALAFTKSSLSQWHCLVTGGHFKLAKISFYFLYYQLKIVTQNYVLLPNSFTHNYFYCYYFKYISCNL